MLKGRARQLARGLLHKFRRARGRLSLRVGRIGSPRPLSTAYGFDRGTPIDRYYIENFLARHADDIHGTVLEVVDSGYSRRFGGDQVKTQHVIDFNVDNEQATIVGDLSDPAVLPSATFDCIVLTQTLHIIYDMGNAVQQLHRALRPGGVILITVPGITPVRPGPDHGWYWSLTEDALRRLLGDMFDPAHVSVSTHGNLFAATAFLHGAALEEAPVRKLEPFDPAYPVIVAARAVADENRRASRPTGKAVPRVGR